MSESNDQAAVEPGEPGKSGESGESGATKGEGDHRHQKERQGIVASAKRQNTITVIVHRRVKHGRYGKFIDRERKYSVHDTLGCQEGDLVRIRETRPLSKTKRWRVIEKLDKHA